MGARLSPGLPGIRFHLPGGPGLSPSARQYRWAMAGSGTELTTLIVLRGNSASGKSTVASALRDRYGRGIAIVGRDNLRHIVLRERDVPGGAYIGLVDTVARYALDHGYHTIIEGIF